MLLKMLKSRNTKYKLAILVRQDLKLPKGKLAVQVAHAAVEAALKCNRRILNTWRKQGGKKVVLKVKDIKELMYYKEKAKKKRLKTVLISDAGLTFLPPGTVTCLAIGPADEKKIDKVSGKLKLL